MAHLITLRPDPNDPAVVYLSTPPELASTMGGFGLARYIGNNPPIPGVSYTLTREDLPRLVVWAANRGVRIEEHHDRPAPRPPWQERRLPECRECGQPRARYANPTRCPQCGEEWRDA